MAEKVEKTKKYILIAGSFRGSDGTIHNVGDTVEMTAATYRAFKHLVEPIAEPELDEGAKIEPRPPVKSAFESKAV